MTETTRNMWVGFFVIFGLIALGVLMVWFGETPSWLGGNEWTLHITDVPSLRGVREGSPVYLNGVEIGRVFALEFENPGRPDEGVIIVTRISDKYFVPRNAFARVYGATLGLGTGQIEIIVIPSRDNEPLPRDPNNIPKIRGEMRSMIGEILSKDFMASLEESINNISKLTAAWTPVGTSVNNLIEPRSVVESGQPGGPPPNLSTAIERIDILVANLNNVLGDAALQDDVRAAVRELRGGAEEFQQAMFVWRTESHKISDNINAGVNRTEENLDNAFARLNGALEKIDDGARSMARVMNDVENGRGTAGKLVRDDRLYEAAVLMFRRISESAATLGRVLGKIEEDGYVTVGQAPSGLLHKKIPIPAADDRRSEPRP